MKIRGNMKNYCKYCDPDIFADLSGDENDPYRIQIFKYQNDNTNWLNIVDKSITKFTEAAIEASININFCPICGRKLN